MQKGIDFPTAATKASRMSQQSSHTIHSDTHLCLSHSLPLIRERWREGETRWYLWCSSGSLQNPCLQHFNNWALCPRPHQNLLLQSIRYSDTDMKYHLELHSCRWGCCFSVVFSWAQRCWSLWETCHQIQVGIFAPVFS